MEGDYGFSQLYWDASTVPDGTYELRARTVCNPSTLSDPPAGLDEAVSQVVVGAMDRIAPRRFGLVSEPADGVYAPGDEISIVFDEQIVSSSPGGEVSQRQIKGRKRLNCLECHWWSKVQRLGVPSRTKEKYVQKRNTYWH